MFSAWHQLQNHSENQQRQNQQQGPLWLQLMNKD
jgi:hypothetical protein